MRWHAIPINDAVSTSTVDKPHREYMLADCMCLHNSWWARSREEDGMVEGTLKGTGRDAPLLLPHYKTRVTCLFIDGQ